MAIALSPQLQQLHDLCQQAQDFVQRPPQDEQALAQLNLQLANAAWDFPEEIGAINAAIANLHEAFGRIAVAQPEQPVADAEAPLQEIVADVLIPPDEQDIEQIFQQFMQIANAHCGARQPAEPAQSIPQPAIQPAQSVPQSNGTAAETPPHIPITPITNASSTPSQQPAALEPNLLSRILQIFQSAIETLRSLFASFIAYCSSYCSGSSNQQSTPTATSTEPPQIPSQSSTPAQNQEQPASTSAQPQAPVTPVPVQTQPQAPVQNEEQPAPIPAEAEAPVNLVPGRFQGVGQIEQGGQRGHQCINAMAIRLWAHLLERRNENEFSNLINAAVADQNENFVENWDFPRFGIDLTQNYRNEIGLINMNALQARQIRAVKIVKENEVHLVVIDARDRNQLGFYYFNPYAENAYLQKFNRFNDLTDHLEEAVPIDVEDPFELAGFRLLQN